MDDRSVKILINSGAKLVILNAAERNEESLYIVRFFLRQNDKKKYLYLGNL